MKVTKESLKAIIGTVWRNRHTHEQTMITLIRKNPYREDFEVYDEEMAKEAQELEEMDTPFGCPMAWVSYGQSWRRNLEHWYRIDTLKKAGKLEGYRSRVGYCRERVTYTRKGYQEMKNIPKEKRDSCHTGSTGMRKNEWEGATRDLAEAEKLLAEFLNGSAHRSDVDETNN